MDIANDHRLWTRNFVLMSVSNLLMGAGFYFLIPTLPVFLVNQLGAGPGEVGYIIAIYTLSAMVIRPVTGYMLDAVGRKWIYIFSFMAFSLMLGLYTLVYSVAWLMVLRFMHGFTWGAATTSSSTIIVDIIPPNRRGEGIGFFGLSFTLAMAVGPVIALAIMGEDNYRALFLSAVAVALSGFFIILMVNFPEYKRPTFGKRFSISNIIEPRTMPMALVQLLFGLTYGGIMSFITLYAQESGIGKPGVFFSLFAAGIAVSRIISGRVFDRKGPAILMMTGLSSGVAGFLVLGISDTCNGFVTAAILVGVCMGIVMPTLQTMANNVVEPQKRGAANATFITAFDIGIGGGSMLLGFVAELTSLTKMYLISAGILAIALSLFFLFVIRYYKTHKITEQRLR